MCTVPVRASPYRIGAAPYSPCGLDANKRRGPPLPRPAVWRGIEGPELSCSHRRHGACKAPLHCAAFSGSVELRSKRRAGSLRPSLAVSAERLALLSPARLLPRVCLHPLARMQWVCPAGTQRARCSRTPCAPDAALGCCCPHPRVARIVCALHNHCGARSRGYRRPSDITRSYAQASCLWRRGARRPAARKPPRPRNPSLCQMAASASLRLLWCRAPGAALPQRPARAALRAPRLRAIPGLLLRLLLSRLRAGLASRLRPGCRRAPRAQAPIVSFFARCCRRRVAPCSPRQCRARLRGSLREH
jgi:hypothetical protein